MQNEPEEYTIFVGGLRDIEEDELEEAFEQFGDLITCSFRSRRSFCFVSYRRKEDAERAIKNMNGKYLGCNPVRVEWSHDTPLHVVWSVDNPPRIIQETTEDYETVFNMTCASNCSVHLKGLKRDTTKETLESIFSPFGIIEDISLYTHYSDYAFINFNSKESATLAICSINNTEIDGSNVKCSWSHRPDYRSDRLLISTSTSSESSWNTCYSSSSSLESGDEFDRIFNEATPNNRTVYCGGLVDSVTNELLEQIFSPFGIVERITLFNERSDYGFIRFNTKEAAALAICSIDGTEISGSTVKCSWSHREIAASTSSESISGSSSSSSLEYELDRIFNEITRNNHTVSCGGHSVTTGDEFDRIFNETTPNNRTVYCGGLVHSVTNELLEHIFSPFGIVENIKLFNERSDYGFIRFNTKEAAALAICSIDGTEINGSTVKCSWSHREVCSSTELQQSSESSPESRLTSVSHLSDRLDRISTQFGLGVPGAAAASASATEYESQAAAMPREKKMEILCKICMDEEMGVVFLPCGHLTSCTKCAKQISTCPVCRRRITSKVRTYLT